MMNALKPMREEQNRKGCDKMAARKNENQQTAQKNESLLRKLTKMSTVSLILGVLTLLTGMAYLVYRFFSERAYREKWKDYDDCGLM
ncbi:MAG: hypothetical protein DBY45_03075 [Clostridiales bacterium]|nr:MAG: hypothetical protein DBY45_03075 [Clostridiales bacterium]